MEKKNLIGFLQINLHINKTVISWKLMWETTPYIKDKYQLSTEYILPEFCIIDHWSEHPTPFIFSKSTWNPISKKKLFYNTLALLYMHVQEISSDNQNVALHNWKNESLLIWINYVHIIFFVKQIWYDFKSQSIFAK